MAKPHTEGTPPCEIDREFPHQVEIAMLGDRLYVMHAYCVSRLFNMRTQSIRTAAGEVTRWCFVDGVHADEFRSRFGGRRFVSELAPN
jgi:hypothetical protein